MRGVKKKKKINLKRLCLILGGILVITSIIININIIIGFFIDEEPPPKIIEKEEDNSKIKVFITKFDDELYKWNNISTTVRVINDYNITYDIFGEWIYTYRKLDNSLIKKRHCKDKNFTYVDINSTNHRFIGSCQLDKTGIWEFNVKILYDKSFDGEGLKKDNRTFEVYEKI